MSTNGTLTTKQRRFMVALLAEPNTRAAALAAGISQRCAWRWLADPVFRAELAARQDAVLAAVCNGLADDAQTARQVLRDTMADPTAPHGVRVRAALGIIDAALRLAELVTLSERVAALERQASGEIDGAA